jgi:chromosome partitioning protein
VARLVAVANQKGGVAKTTTVHSLGFALAERGRRVLLVDLDPQADLTHSTGFDAAALDCSIHDVLEGTVKTADACRPVPGTDRLAVLPASFELVVSEVALAPRIGREYALSAALEEIRDDYDVVFIDCPPSLGILTVNALTAAHEVLIPTQCETLSDRGVSQLLELVADVRMFTNADLAVRGVIATMYDRHTVHSRAVLAGVRERHGLQVLEPPVRKSIRFAEAAGVGRCILEHAPTSPGAEAYRVLAARIDASLACDPFIGIGSAVSVRDRYQGKWTHGFDVAELTDHGYVLRRTSDRTILPGTFAVDDVRSAVPQLSTLLDG